MSVVTIGGSEAIAWAAGLFEGEGCFYGNGARIRVSLLMTDEWVVRRFAETVGCGKVYARYDPRETRHSPSWKWEASTEREFKLVFELFAPFLSPRRTGKALSLLDERRAHIAAYEAPRPCQFCGRSFSRTWRANRRRLYCSAACKQHAHQAKRKAMGWPKSVRVSA